MSPLTVRRLTTALLRATDQLRSRLVLDTFASICIKSLYLALQLLISVILARLLGPSGYGSYAFALTMIALLAIPAQFGFPPFLARSLPVYTAHRQYDLLRGLLTRSRHLVAFSALLIAAATAATLWGFHLTPGQIPTPTLLTALTILPLLALLETNGGALRGIGRVVIAQVPSELLRPALLVGIVLAAAILHPLAPTPTQALLANAAATAIALVIGWWLLSRHAPRASAQAVPRMASRAWLTGALPFTLLSSAQLINRRADIFILGVMTSQHDVGLYRVATQAVDALGLPLMAISAVIAPRLARLHSNHDWLQLRRLLVLSHRAGMALLLPASILLVFAGGSLLSLVFGPVYAPSADALSILALGKAFYAAAAFSGLAVTMFGHPAVATLGTALGAALNVALNILLIPYLGIEAAALATSLTSVLVALGLAAWIFARYRLNIAVTGRAVGPTREGE